MRIAIVGQQDFGKAVLEAFLSAADTVAGVFCAPEKPGAPPDPLRLARRGAAASPSASCPRSRPRRRARRCAALDVDLGVMAYVLQFAPQDFCTIPRHGMIQYHPSLLPRYRGPSSINWPIIRGDTAHRAHHFPADRRARRRSDHPAEGDADRPPTTRSGASTSTGCFRMGVAALQEAADLVVSGTAPTATVQDESQASYEGWCRDAEAAINWHNHVDLIYNLIRGCDPRRAPGPRFNGKKLSCSTRASTQRARSRRSRARSAR